jgi:hypothetical protein
MFSQRLADDVDSRNNELFNRFYPNLTEPMGAVAITGTAHYDFTDMTLLTPLAYQLGLKGPLRGKQVTKIVNDYLLSFFEATLDGKPSPLLEGSIHYAEVNIIK